MFYITDHHELSTRFKREINEDCCFYIHTGTVPAGGRKLSIQCVLDGVSSSNGRLASDLASRELQCALCELIFNINALEGMSEGERRDHIYSVMRNAVRTADAVLRAQQVKCETTVSIAVVYGDILYACNVGDSPIFLYDLMADRLTSVYTCHNESGRRVAEGLISKEEALSSPDKNRLMRSVGGRSMLFDEDITAYCDYLPQDSVLLLGSDGALSVFGEEELKDMILNNMSSMRELCFSIQDRVESSDSTDNFTVMASHIKRS